MRAQRWSHSVTFRWLWVNKLMNWVSAPGAVYIYHLQVVVQSCAITASKCIYKLTWLRPPRSHHHDIEVYISKLAWSRPPSWSPNLLKHGLQLYLPLCSSTPSEFARSWPPSASPNLLDYGLQVHLHTRLILISECISKFTPLWPPIVSPTTLNHDSQVHLQTCSIISFEWMWEFTRSSFSSTPRIALKHRLQPVQIYCVLMGSNIDT